MERAGVILMDGKLAGQVILENVVSQRQRLMPPGILTLLPFMSGKYSCGVGV